MGVTIIMITHDMHLMLEYTDRTLVLTGGKLIMDATPSEVLTDRQVCDRAYLKTTSLYDLALKCGIGDAGEFARRFIEYERTQWRSEGSEGHAVNDGSVGGTGSDGASSGDSTIGSDGYADSDGSVGSTGSDGASSGDSTVGSAGSDGASGGAEGGVL